MLSLISENTESEVSSYRSRIRNLKYQVRMRLMYRGQMEFKHFHYLRNMMLGVKPAEYYINKIRKARKVSQRERELLLLYWKLNQIIFVSEHKTLELAYSKPMGMDEIFRAKIRNYNKLEQKRAKQRAYNSTMRGRRR